MNAWTQVLDYWIGDQTPPDPERRKRWFQSTDDIDEEIAQRFAQTHSRLQNGYPGDWPDSSEGRLAAIIVIDQFSRNLYRGQAEAFAWDELAANWSLGGLERGLFTHLSEAEQGFAVLPLVHSESLTLHDRALSFLETIQHQANTDGIITGFLSSAREHRDIIAQFGRYPHRNAVLNRPSTPEESAYLAQGAKRFGQ